MKIPNGLKVLSILSVCLLLQACTGHLSSLFSGNSAEKIAINPVTNEVAVNPLTRQPIKIRETQTQAAAVSEDSATAITAVAKVEEKRLDLEILKVKNGFVSNDCDPLTFQQLDQLKADAQSAYMRGVEKCRDRVFFASMMQSKDDLIKVLVKGSSDLKAVADAYGLTIRSVASEGTKKVQAFTHPFSDLLKIKVVAEQTGETIRNGQDAQSAQAIAAVENAGDITVSGISTSQSATSTSGSAGELGTSGSATSSTQKEGDTINIGRNISVSQARDDSRVFSDTRSTQQLESSANGGVNDGSNVDQQPIIDENNGDQNNQPENGSNNGVF